MVDFGLVVVSQLNLSFECCSTLRKTGRIYTQMPVIIIAVRTNGESVSVTKSSMVEKMESTVD